MILMRKANRRFAGFLFLFVSWPVVAWDQRGRSDPESLGFSSERLQWLHQKHRARVLWNTFHHAK
jgi:hypothetical protein